MPIALFVLVPSPLVGPATWEPVAAALRDHGYAAVVPALVDREDDPRPTWRQHAGSVARALAAVDAETPLILAGHSGAGPLLPAIRAQLGRPVAAYCFVDAGVPRDGASRLDLMAAEAPEWAAEFRQELEAGARFPIWTDADLREVVLDAEQRAALLAELRPRPLAFFTEPIPVFAGWPDAPCAYLQFSAAYDVPAAQAQQAGWAYRRLAAGHFHLLVDPAGVARAMVDLVRSTATS
jgi:hypothetical protein